MSSVIRFIYPNDIATVESAVRQGIAMGSCAWTNLPGAGNFRAEEAAEAAAHTIEEVRRILTGELATLLDGAGIATEWNQAIEQAIQLVEGTLP